MAVCSQYCQYIPESYILYSVHVSTTFLIIASKMSSSDEDRVMEHSLIALAGQMENFSMDVIAASLVYRNDTKLRTICQKNISKRNKIAELFNAWQEENGNWSWRRLTNSLKSLNNRDLMEWVKEHRNNIPTENGMWVIIIITVFMSILIIQMC